MDVGVHMGKNNKQKYPDFTKLKDKFKKSDINDVIDIVLISHFHLDHCAALPVLTEIEGYNKPIFASTPTKYIMNHMLKDFIKITQDNVYDLKEQMVAPTVSKVNTIALRETKTVDDVEITAYYAGHILGAVMFLVKYKGIKVVYTGDFSSTADRHLRGCEIDRVEPDIIISESTYGTVVREWKKERELKFMTQIKKCFDRGGKMLIPVFALGRAQELFILIEDIWKKTGWKYPVYFSAGLTNSVNKYYKVFTEWMNDSIKDKIRKDGVIPFNLKFIHKLDMSVIRLNEPMLVLATPGMMHAGTSLKIFQEWCSDKKNSLLIPGYCVEGTVGNLVLKGHKTVKVNGVKYDVNMEVSKMSFSAHADHKGIVALMDYIRPKNIVFVHGDAERMDKLGEYIEAKNSVKCYCPGNFESLKIKVPVKEQFIYSVKNVGNLPQDYTNFVIAKSSKDDGEERIVEMKVLEDDEFIVKREPLDS